MKVQTDLSSLPTPQASPGVSAPLWPVLASSIAAVAAIICVPAGAENFKAAVLGYVLGALVVPALTEIYRFRKRKAGALLVENARMKTLLQTALVLGILAGIACAWFVATELAKQ